MCSFIPASEQRQFSRPRISSTQSAEYGYMNFRSGFSCALDSLRKFLHSRAFSAANSARTVYALRAVEVRHIQSRVSTSTMSGRQDGGVILPSDRDIAARNVAGGENEWVASQRSHAALKPGT